MHTACITVQTHEQSTEDSEDKIFSQVIASLD